MPVSVNASVDQILAKFIRELGQTENPHGSNKTKYGAWAVAEGHKGMQGVAWCNIFISWGFEDLLPFYAYTPSSAQYFKDRGAWISKSEKPRRGDIVWFDFPNDGVNRISHIGIVEGVLADGRIATIEGNTNGAGSRTGGNVMRHNRSVAGGIVGYGRINYLGSLSTPGEEEDMGKAVLAKGDKSPEWWVVNAENKRYVPTVGHAAFGQGESLWVVAGGSGATVTPFVWPQSFINEMPTLVTEDWIRSLIDGALDEDRVLTVADITGAVEGHKIDLSVTTEQITKIATSVSEKVKVELAKISNMSDVEKKELAKLTAKAVIEEISS